MLLSSTRLTQSALQPSAERYVIFFCVSVFALYKRKNPGAPWAYRYNGKYHAAAGLKAVPEPNVALCLVDQAGDMAAQPVFKPRLRRDSIGFM